MAPLLDTVLWIAACLRALGVAAVGALAGGKAPTAQAGAAPAGYSDLVYRRGGAEYRVRYPRRRGPLRYDRLRDPENRDVTGRVELFAGPEKNFHGIPTTPAMLGFETLTLESRLGDSVVFGAADPIVLWLPAAAAAAGVVEPGHRHEKAQGDQPRRD